jgi:hypothetical protein
MLSRLVLVMSIAALAVSLAACSDDAAPAGGVTETTAAEVASTQSDSVADGDVADQPAPDDGSPAASTEPPDSPSTEAPLEQAEPSGEIEVLGDLLVVPEGATVIEAEGTARVPDDDGSATSGFSCGLSSGDGMVFYPSGSVIVFKCPDFDGVTEVTYKCVDGEWVKQIVAGPRPPDHAIDLGDPPPVIEVPDAPVTTTGPVLAP